MFKLTFLGTSAGIPTKQRNVTALAVECINPFTSQAHHSSKTTKPWILVDCGEATQHQLLKTRISSRQLAVICITHVHGDHCYGLPGLLASMAMSGRQDPLTIIAPQAIEQFIEAVKVMSDLYLPFDITFISIESLLKSDSSPRNQPIKIKLSATHTIDIEVTALSHRVASHAFSLTQTVSTIKLDIDKLKADGIEPNNGWGKLQAGQDVVVEGGEILRSEDYTHQAIHQVKIVIAGDNDTPELLTNAVKDASLLVHEATYTQAVADKIMSRDDAIDPMHTTAKRIASFASSSNLPNLILTHFSARYQVFDNPDSTTTNMADIRQEAEQFYKGNLWLARDFYQFEVTDKDVKPLIEDKAQD